MKLRRPFELPEEVQDDLSRARRVEWISLGVMATVAAAVYLTMGASQTMKASLIEDLLAFVPPVAYLIADRFARREPDHTFPYGYHRAVSIAFLAGAVALTIFGGYILFDSVMSLVDAEHPVIGTMVVFGEQVWAGWLMMAALAYSTVAPFTLGRMKLPLSRSLHDKTLRADADMNRADWLTGVAGIAGVTGIGLGWWWADAVVAGLIALSIVRDGFENLGRVVRDLMDRRPSTVDGHYSDLPDRVREVVLELGWVRDAAVRMREEGHVFTGEVFVVMADAGGTGDLPARLAEAARAASAVDWRVHDVVVTVVEALE